MENKIHIEDAIAFGKLTTGKTIKEIEAELRRELWPNSSASARYQNLKLLKDGATRTLDNYKVHTICKICKCDPSMLFNFETK